ncbi:choice-of-anchor P family protein [Actinokineospora auranticolor]|uniref:MspA protein n=1 Tax=Actinokineospora auranticolor TaxID=155976 RepID=A0A2S6GCY6_9PSEU|nr:choice-of-anchor P family protein [Actinokineospora auranticolor]PPK63113.1 hypothetical protein CLV40_13246 [Actinokineospora auranticolor]
MRSISRRWMTIPAAVALAAGAAVSVAQPAAAVTYTFNAHANAVQTTGLLGVTVAGSDYVGATPGSDSTSVTTPSLPVVGSVGSASSLAEGTRVGALDTAHAEVSLTDVDLLSLPLVGTVISVDSIESTVTTEEVSDGVRDSSGGAQIEGLTILGNAIPDPNVSQDVSLGGLGTVHVNYVDDNGSSITVHALWIETTIGPDIYVGTAATSLT